MKKLKTWLFSLRLLWTLLNEAVTAWRKEIPKLDEPHCCDGSMCGCMGVTNREHWVLVFNNFRGE